MPVRFITCGDDVLHRIRRTGEAWEHLREIGSRRYLDLRYRDQDHEAAESIRDYASTHLHSTAYVAPDILRPAGSTVLYRLDASDQATGFIVAAKLVETARHGLPDVFDCCLYIKRDGEMHQVSMSQPFENKDDAIRFFGCCLEAPEARQLADLLGGSKRAALFALAAQPSCTEDLVRVPNPTGAEVARLSEALQSAASRLSDVLAQWEGTDALRYLEGRYIVPKGLAASVFKVVDRASALAKDKDMTVRTKRAGRHVMAGREQLVASTLAELWVRCGLGTPSTAPQSRFIRAVQFLLPQYGVYKADVSQFMRTALSKERRWGVVIG